MAHRFELSGHLPAPEVNGLAALEDAFLAVETPSPVWAVVQIVRSHRTVSDGSGDVRSVAKIARLEVAAGPVEEAVVSDLLVEFGDRRTGRVQLPVEIEQPGA